MTTLSVVLGTACKEWRLTSYNPASNFQKLKEPPGRDRFLTEDELERLFASCKESKCKQLYPIVLLAVCTGMRKGEIVNLRWRDIDFGEELIKLEKTKNGDKRYVPIKNPVLALLKEKAKETPHHPDSYLFASPKSGKPINFTSSWINALKRANIDNFVLHSLRATCVTHLTKLGYPLHLIAKIVGHREISTTYQRYSCLGLEEHAEATEKLGNFLENI